MATPRLSVLIVTWNCRALIGPCLEHLFASRINGTFEVIVVDNASHDDTPGLIRAHYPQVTVIDSGGNLGFSRGNNLAAQHARGDYLLFLNPDAYLTDRDALAKLCAALDEDRDGRVGAVAPALSNLDGSHQVGDAGYAPTIGNVTRHQWLLSRLVPGLHGFYVNNPVLLRRSRVSVEWLAATCLLIRRTLFEQVGGFDPSFFMYGEDVDLGVRMHATGKQLLLLPEIRVLHLQGATQRSDSSAIHVSFGWIDAIFALHRGNDRKQRLRRRVLATSMAGGFLVRAAAYRLKGARNKADAMRRYAQHSWTAAR